MRTRLSTYRRLILCFVILVILYFIPIHFKSFIPNIRFKTNDISNTQTNNQLCFKYHSKYIHLFKSYQCLPINQIISIVWTHHGTGLFKYIQWIVTRKLVNVKITQLDDNCQIIQHNSFISNSTNHNFIEIYILSLTMNFDSQSPCSIDLIRIINSFQQQQKSQIYFRRKSLQATLGYEHLDSQRYNYSHHSNANSNWNISIENRIDKANITTNNLMKYLNKNGKSQSLIVNDEDLIYSNLVETERSLINLLSLLKVDTSNDFVRRIIEYDSHHFTADATWWDQSNTMDNILSSSIPSKTTEFSYSNDYYHLTGNRSFKEYVGDSRKCFNDGIFVQMSHERLPNRISTDKPNRCLLKKFDCDFSDIYSFKDREQLYQYSSVESLFNVNPIKCGFAMESNLDKVRNLYGRNETCRTIVFTCISNCYDPLPTVTDTLPADICFVALLDTKTYNAFKKIYTSTNWNLIDLGESASLFRVPAKITESLKMLGYRLFPLAKWYVWLDGKAYIINIKEVLSESPTPIIGLHHHDYNRTSENEVPLTIVRVKVGEQENSLRLNTTLEEIDLQYSEYTKDGFYSRSNSKGLPMFDIAIFIYRNNHPCAQRYLCGWHNEVNYYSYRGQLSVYYSAERLNISHYLSFVPRHHYHTMAHNSMC